MFKFCRFCIVVLLIFGLAACGKKKDNLQEVATKFKLENVSAVEGDFDLPKKFKDGEIEFNVTWSSNASEVVKVEEYASSDTKFVNFYKAKVSRPDFESGDKELELTATFKIKGKEDIVIKYPVKVIALPEVEVEGTHVIINQIYGGGGNNGATYKNDFVELYNPTNKDIDLTGWTLQYASKTGDFKLEATYPVIVELSGTIKAGKYYLIQLGAGAAGTKALPTPDAVGEISAAATDGKFALTNKKQVVTSPTDAHVVDFVGYGSETTMFEGSAPTVKASNTLAVVRINFIDTNDNAADFTTASPNPRNSKN